MTEEEIPESKPVRVVGAIVVVVAGTWYAKKTVKSLIAKKKIKNQKIKNFDYAMSAIQRFDRIINSPAHDLDDLKTAIGSERDFLEFISTEAK